MKSRYYEAELAYLRDQGRAFARAFPNTAGFLAERSDDPDVERLLEGVAFLASRIRERMDDAVPELSAHFCAALVPHLTRFVPPIATIQFAPDPPAMRGSIAVPRGSQVAGRAGDGTQCLFTTTADVHLLPVTLVSVSTERPTSRVEKIILRFEVPEAATAVVGAKPIRLHFAGEFTSSLTLRAWFLRHCTQITLVSDRAPSVNIPAKITAIGLTGDTRLLPEQPLEHDAFAYVHELFAAPEKFAFVDLPPLNSHVRPSFELHFSFDRPPKLPRSPGKDDIRLHCVPVVNLFPCSSDPIRFKPLHPEALIRPADYAPANAEVYEVETVTGISRGQRVTYPRFTTFRGSSSPDSRYFVTRRIPAVADTGTETYLSLASPRDTHLIAEKDVLALELVCSNRGLATTLRLGELSQPVRGGAAVAAFANITPISPPLYPHDNVELLWRLGAHLGLSRRGLQDADSLRQMLEIYNFAERWNPQLGRVNGTWIDAIREVQSRRLTRLVRGAPVTGTKITLILDEANFSSPGEALLFGDIINELYARRVSVNSFNQLNVALMPSNRLYTWPARYGDRSIL